MLHIVGGIPFSNFVLILVIFQKSLPFIRNLAHFSPGSLSRSFFPRPLTRNTLHPSLDLNKKYKSLRSKLFFPLKSPCMPQNPDGFLPNTPTNSMAGIQVMFSLGPLKKSHTCILCITHKKDLSLNIPYAALPNPRCNPKPSKLKSNHLPTAGNETVETVLLCTSPLPWHIVCVWPVPHRVPYPPASHPDSLPLTPFCHSGQNTVVVSTEEKLFSKVIFQSGSVKVAKGNIYNNHGKKEHYYPLTFELYEELSAYKHELMNNEF